LKKILMILFVMMLVIGVTVPMAIPVAANNPPQSWLSDTQILHSENIGNTQVTICGAILDTGIPSPYPTLNYYSAVLTPADGTFVGHTVFPNGKSTEDSWFKLTQFKGYIIFSNPADYPNVVGIPGISIFQYDFTGNIKVNIHNGPQSNQPIITIRSSIPISINIPMLDISGDYNIIQLKGWQIIHAGS
jgi:hypothetical protein